MQKLSRQRAESVWENEGGRVAPEARDAGELGAPPERSHPPTNQGPKPNKSVFRRHGETGVDPKHEMR